MKAHVDISIFSSATESYGIASGLMNFEVLPRQEELVSFSISASAPPDLGRFSFFLKVEHVLHQPRDSARPLVLSLEQAVFETPAQAESFLRYLEHGFGLFADRF